MKPYNGLFITLEGCDGSGKSSLARNLEYALSALGHSVYRTREPGGPPLAEHLRGILLSRDAFPICPRAEVLLFLAARAQNMEEAILPALRQGTLVLCERFHDSTLAYQAYARHLPVAEIEQLCRLSCGGIEPDITLLLDLPAHLALARVCDDRDRMESEKVHFHEAVRKGYLRLAEEHAERIRILDGEAPMEAVTKAALDCILPLLPR